MIDMKSSRQDDPILSSGNDYPWGLRLHLGNEEIEKLNLQSADVSDEMIIVAKVKIVGKSQNADETETHRSMELQITEMDVPNSSADGKAARLYGDNG